LARAHHVALGATVANTVITAGKFVLAVLTGSLALWGEAFHSLADIATSGLVFIALLLSRKPVTVPSKGRRSAGGTSGSARAALTGADGTPGEADEEDAARAPEAKAKRRRERLRSFFVFKFQKVVAVVIAIMLLGVAYSVLSKVFQTAPVSEAQAIRLPLVAGLVMLLFSGVSLAISKIELAVGVREGAVALAADGAHAKSDMLASICVAVSLFGTALGAQWMDKVGAGVVGALIAILALEIIANVIHALLRGYGPEGAPPYQSRILLAVFHADAVDGLLRQLEGRFGWKLAGNRFLRNLRRVFWPLAAGMVLVSLASTSLFTVGPGELAFKKRFGAVVGSPHRPGLHAKWPWPVDAVERIQAYEVTRLGLGYKGEDTARAFLWTRAHYAEEYNFILRDGTEMMTVFMEVFYRPRAEDLRRYAYYGAGNIRAVMEAVSYRELLEEMSHREFFTTVTTDRDALMGDIGTAIQAHADKLGLGVEVVEVAFRDMHPPWQVAGAYLDVLSAEEELYMREYRARGTQSRYVAQAAAGAIETVLNAETEAQSKILRTRGESERYRVLRDAYGRYGSLLSWPLYLETLEQALGRTSCHKYVVEGDATVNLDYWINFTRPGRE